MAKAIITLTDNPAKPGNFTMDLEFDPPQEANEPMTSVAVQAAMVMVQALADHTKGEPASEGE